VRTVATLMIRPRPSPETVPPDLVEQVTTGACVAVMAGRCQPPWLRDVAAARADDSRWRGRAPQMLSYTYSIGQPGRRTHPVRADVWSWREREGTHEYALTLTCVCRKPPTES